jgi:hypothetical protein
MPLLEHGTGPTEEPELPSDLQKLPNEVYERLKRGNPAISYKPAYRINKKTGRVSTVPDFKCWHCSFAHGDYSVYRRHSRLHNPREQRTCANPSLEATRPTTVGPELSGLQGVSKEEYERMKNGNPAIKYRKIIRWKRGRRVPETGLKCWYCPYVNTSYKSYLPHSRYHGSKERYTCDVTGCDYSANRHATVAKHQTWHHMLPLDNQNSRNVVAVQGPRHKHFFTPSRNRLSQAPRSRVHQLQHQEKVWKSNILTICKHKPPTPSLIRYLKITGASDGETDNSKKIVEAQGQQLSPSPGPVLALATDTARVDDQEGMEVDGDLENSLETAAADQVSINFQIVPHASG